jgi:cellulose biosynthesis protein BcsQ
MAELLRNKDTVQPESALEGAVVRQLALKIMLEPYETNFDAVIIDVSPSSNLFQTCAMVYARNVVIPVNMDLLRLNGANAAYIIRLLNELIKFEIQPLGLMPCQVDQRLSVTTLVQQEMPVIVTTVLPVVAAAFAIRVSVLVLAAFVTLK